MKRTGIANSKAAFIVCVSCIILLTALFVAMLMLAGELWQRIAAAIGIITAITLAVLIAAQRKFMQSRGKELGFYVQLQEKLRDIVFIWYNDDTKTAQIRGDIEIITGIANPPRAIEKQAYDKLIEELTQNKHDFEDDIYMTPGEKQTGGKYWYRLTSHKTGNIVLTTIRDMSQYMEKLDIINNLRYYDSITGLLTKQALTDMLRRKTGEQGYRSAAAAHLSIVGIDRVSSFEGADTADEIMAKLASSVKSFEGTQSMLTGRTSANGITAVISNSSFEFYDYYDLVIKIFRSITGAVNELAGNVNRFLSIYCGYIIYTDGETDADKILAEAEFAAFDAHKQKSTDPVRYNEQSFENSENEFGKIKAFNEIITNELIDYHYQPIVNVRTGDIYGYEALMRPHEVNGIQLSPLELLGIAQNQNMLERIEQITLSKTLKILSENQDIFHDRRLFVNSVSCITLPEVEYLGLANIYSELFSKLVIEITESNKLSDSIMPMMDKYFRQHKAHIALDDYGAGYSNERTLLDVMPNYIKIDHELITGINNDEHKKQLVSNIVSYASAHGVYSLAEGVETEEELETVIFLGVDLIQGYFTCRPVPIFMHEIAGDIKSLVVKYSIMHAKRDDKVYEVNDDTPVDLINLAVFGYSDIVVRHGEVSFYSDAAATLNMRIICSDNTNVLMRFKDVRLHSDDNPVLTIGENSTFTLQLEGDNTLSKQGIRVPETSSLIIEGEGNLSVECSSADGVCIGGNSTQSFGRIDLNTAGRVSLTNKCDRGICVGGGIGSADHPINVNSGDIVINSRGTDALGIGALTGDTLIMLNDGKITADVSGINAVAVGSMSGNPDIRSSADISVLGAGNNCCLIGTVRGEHTHIELHKGNIAINASGMNIVGIGSAGGRVDISSNADIVFTGSGDNCTMLGTHSGREGVLTINRGQFKVTCNAKVIAALGTISGACDITITAGIFDFLCEGNSAVCIGNIEGGGDITLSGLIINAVSNSALSRNIVTADGKISITSGNIYTNSAEEIEAYNPIGTRLARRHVTGDKDAFDIFDIKVKDKGSVYRYVAKPTDLFDGFYVYLPEDSDT